MLRKKKKINHDDRKCTLDEALKDPKIKNQFYVWSFLDNLLEKNDTKRVYETMLIWLPKAEKFLITSYPKYSKDSRLKKYEDALTEEEFRKKYSHLLKITGNFTYWPT